MKRVFFRCNDGHYFTGESCPFDGWGTPETARLARLLKEVDRANLSLDSLAALQVSAELRKRIAIVEFADAEAAFEGIAAEYYFVNGQLVHRDDVPDAML